MRRLLVKIGAWLAILLGLAMMLQPTAADWLTRQRNSKMAQQFAANTATAADAAKYDRLALGCPSMGDEVLEELEFEPFFTELENRLSGKRVVLFGSYGWGDGQWMREWQKRTDDDGASLCADGLIVNETPDEDGLAQCRALGNTIATA